MPVVAIFDFPGEPIEKYHDGFTVVDLWTDEQSFADFDDIIGPATARVGLDAKPVVYPVAGIVTESGEQSRW